MTCMDRYLLRSFLKSLLVCFLSLAGLYVVVDLFTNLDEFISLGQRDGSLWPVLSQYYGARVLAFFERTSGILTLIAAIFTITWLQRHNEMTALLAAGISKARITKPIVLVVALISLLSVMNRELVLPLFQNRLARNVQDWHGEQGVRLNARYDHETRILIRGKKTFANQRMISRPNFRLPPKFHSFARSLVAEAAYYQAGEGPRPGGYLLKNVGQPKSLTDMPSAIVDGRTIIYSPYDTSWLDPGECYVASNVDFAQLQNDNRGQRFASTASLIAGLHNAGVDYGARVRVLIHKRFVRPILDMTLLFLGLPLVLTGTNRNIFVAIGTCILLVAGFSILVIFSHSLGNQYLVTPVLSVWLPVAVFVPVAAALSQPFFE